MTTVIVQTPTCSVCGKTTLVELDEAKVERWLAGEHIQVVWPEMPKDEREMLISGTHPACWDRLFAGTEW